MPQVRRVLHASTPARTHMSQNQRLLKEYAALHEELDNVLTAACTAHCTETICEDGWALQALVAEDREPITPLIARVRALAAAGVSTVLCVGGCGDYFDVADTVIMADAFQYHVRLCLTPHS